MLKSILVSGAMMGLAAGAHAHEDGGADHASDHPDKVVSADTGASVENPFHPVRLLLANDESAGSVTIYEFLLPPQSPGSPPHTHTQEDEYFYVLEGSLDILSGGEVKRLQPGDFAALNRGHAHMFWNGSDTDTKLLMMTTGSSFEAFMEGVSPRLAEQKPGSPAEAGAVIGQLAAEHGIEISMETMPEEAAPYYAPPAEGD
ncbi:cupin domain-containing protein [Henriciella sp.]|uniref:cupin domain-containing protein n=1 Tax=Henriciella sp. TaxID=1968823 RepID=UPI00260FF078|nr:cupin domain-containing protein [Henriciella sp.]